MGEDNGTKNGTKRERDGQGRFLPGNSGGPGRPPGPTTVDLKAAIRGATSSRDVVAIFLKAIDQAKHGNDPARRFVFSTLGLIEILVDVTSGGEKIDSYSPGDIAEALAILGLASNGGTGSCCGTT